MIQKTLVLIKPDGVQRCLSGRIISKFEDVGLKIIGMKMVWVDAEFAKKHYFEHIEKDFYRGLETVLTMGPVIAMVLEGVESIAKVRQLVGSTEPKSAAPGTIRGDFAHISYGYADKNGLGIKNLIHASDSSESAQREISLWFEEKEIHTYKNVHDVHIYN
jgi:nucleoside-diphosphate kinase